LKTLVRYQGTRTIAKLMCY